MAVDFISSDQHTEQIAIQIGAALYPLEIVISEIEGEAEVFPFEDEWTVKWTRANISFHLIGEAESIWEAEVYPDELRVTKSLVDSHISDACDTAASAVFYQQRADGIIEV